MGFYQATSQPPPSRFFAVYVCDLLFKQEIKFSLFTAVQHRTHPLASPTYKLSARFGIALDPL